MAAAQAHRNAARWTVAMAIGLRQSEALALRWVDVDLEQGTLTVRRGVHRVRGQGLVYEEPKADRSRRTLALPGPLVEALRAHRAVQLEERLVAGGEWANLDLVFAQPNGKAIERKSDWRAWKAVLQGAGVRDVRLHDGRHTGGDPPAVRGRPPASGHGSARPRTDADDHGHLQPRHASPRPRRRGPHGQSTVGLT